MKQPQIFRFEWPNIQENLKFRTPGYQFLTRPTTAILPKCAKLLFETELYESLLFETELYESISKYHKSSSKSHRFLNVLLKKDCCWQRKLLFETELYESRRLLLAKKITLCDRALKVTNPGQKRTRAGQVPVKRRTKTEQVHCSSG